MHERNPCVYILTNKRNGTLYVGVTSNLKRRVHEHKSHVAVGFTTKHKLERLVYFECTETMYAAISREKQIKAGSRRKKIALIESMNPGWDDLFTELTG